MTIGDALHKPTPRRLPSGRSVLAYVALLVLLMPLGLGWLPRPGDRGTAPVDGFTLKPMAASLAVATCSAAIAVTLGGLFAAALVLGRLRWRGLWATLLLIPFAAPPTVWTLTQIACYGRGGLAERWLGDSWRPVLSSIDASQYLSTTLVLAQVHAPLAMLVLLRGFGRLQFAGLEAARLFFRNGGWLRWILGALRQELLAAYLLAFALSLGNFAVPHVMQCRLYIIEVYLRSSNYLDQLGAMHAALPLAALALAAAIGFALLDRGKSYGSMAGDVAHGGSSSWLVCIALATYVGLVIVLPVGALAVDCRSIADFFQAVQAAAPETLNTLLIASGAATVACIAAGVVAPWAVRRRHVFAELLSLVPLGLPAMLLGLAYARTYNAAWPLGFTLIVDTSLLAMLGLAARGLPFSTRILAAGARRQARQWEEAGQVAGMSIWRQWRWIRGPLWLNPAATAAIVVFVLAAGDVEVSHLLTAPGSGTLAMRLFTFLHFGPAHVTASLALWQLIVVLVPVLVYFLLTDRWLNFI